MKNYRITASESHNEKGAEFETKSLLYMMNYYRNSNDIHWFAIDFFNDVTGINKLQDTCYDLQSKGIKDINPKQLGKYLITLFKNYLSDFNFSEFILFVEGVSRTIRNEICSNVFTIYDLSESIKNNVKEGLAEEARVKSYIEDKDAVNDININAFLEKVIFVIDDKTKEQYIKDAVNLSENLVFDNKYLLKIFKEIRDKQSSKKNNNVERKILVSIGCFSSYDKYIRKDEIESLIISRLSFNKAFKNWGDTPKEFWDSVNFEYDIQTDEVDKCKDDILLLLSDKNNVKAYRDLFFDIITCIKDNKESTINEIYDKIDKRKLSAVRHLDALSCKYFISLIKENINASN